MKKEAGRQGKKWLLPVLIAAAVLVIASVVLGFVLGAQQTQSGSGAIESKIYWNVDREQFIEEETGLSVREPAEDGNYYVLFAVGGEQKELQIVDKQLVNVVDSMSAMGLVFDNDGTVVEAVPVKEFATELAVGLFVQEVRDDAIVVNSSIAMNGMEFEIPLNENSGIYDVSPDAEVVGQSATCDIFDAVNAYADAEGNTTDVLITEHPKESKVYWRAERKYNDEKAETSRVPDEQGVYSVDFAVDGEVVTLKCKDKDLLSNIDGRGRYNADMGLVFDEEGYFIDTFTTNIALRGVLTMENVEVLESDGKTFYAEGQLPGGSNGKTFNGVVGENCKVYDVSDAAETFGEPTTLRPGDRIKAYSDVNGNLIYVLVMNRLVDSPMYYNMSRCYLINGVTTREPENGWYIFEMAGNGTVKEYRTRDLKLASKLDSFGYRCVGLRVNGDIIEKVYDPASVAGYYSFGAFQYITTLTPPIIGTESADKTASASGIITADCKIMNVTGIGVEKGMEDTLRLGDQIVAYTNAKMEVNHVVIINRIVEGTKVAWNHTRKYDAELEKTTREKVDGYYEFRVAIDGKDTVVKTSSEKLATKMDSMNPQMFALKLNGNIVQEVYPPVAATGGATRSNWFKVKRISAEEIETYSIYGSGTTMLKPSKEMKVYNVSEGFDNHWGERTTLKVGDQIHAITDRSGDTVIIFVRSREVDSPLYWNKTRKYNATTEETTREPIDGYYVYELAVGGQLKTFKTADKELASRIDSYKIAFALKVEGDIIKQVYPGKSAKGIKQSTASWLDVMSIDGTKVYVQQNIPTAEDKGKGYEITLDSNCKFYNVSSYAEPFGHATDLTVGDRIHAFINDDDKVAVCYIVRENTRAGGAFDHCEHCDKEVYWMPWSGEAFYQADGHYYLTHNVNLGKQLSIGEENKGQYDMVLDLNGHTVTASKRAFLVWEGTSFSIMDSVGGGSIVANGIDGQAGTIMVYSGGKLNIYDGIYGRTDAQSEVATSNGGVIYSSGKESEVNIYGGTIQGGNAKFGGAIYVATGKLNIHGGNIIGSEAERGGAIYNDSGVITMTGGTMQGGSCQIGGAVYMLSGSFTMSGGTVTGGTSTGIGGNFYLGSSSTLNITGGSVTNGNAVRGGNIGGYGIANISGGTVDKGEATYGGNICGLDNLRITISGNAKITDGTATSGGNIFLTKVDTARKTMSELTVSGGTITGGLTVSGKGSNIETYREAKVTLSGGNISGDILLTNGTTVTLSGDVTVGKGKNRGLYLESNVFAKLDNLGENASICISKVGAFTQSIENAEEYADNFYSYDPDLLIAASKNVLHCGKFALCSHCNDVVSWSPWTNESRTVSGHYYLTGKTQITTQYTVGNDEAVYDIVLDLKGNAIESASRAFLVWKGSSLTVMDSVGGGQIAAAGVDGNAGTVMIYEGGIFNLLSGTLTRTEQKNATSNGGVIYISGGSSRFNMSGGTITGGEAVTGGNIYVSSGIFTMTGGTVSGGTCTNLGGNIYAATDAKIDISGGTITGTTGEFRQMAGSKVTISGGAVECQYYIESSATTTLSGAPKITKLQIATGALLTLGELTGEADITVSANGTFTNANADVANYIGFFTPAKQADSIEIRENALVYVKAVKDLNTVSNANLTLDADKNAVCPVCDEEVTWTGISADQAVTLDNGHYYLESDVTYTGTETPFLTAPTGNKTICLHLNGKNITATSHAAIDAASGTLNIMGSGTVTGSRSENLFGATITNKGATINLIGGTYTKATSATLSSVMTLRGGDVNMYNGAALLGVDDGGSASTARVYNRSFNMYGGKISGGSTQIITSNWSTTVTGQFNMYGGEVVGTVSINGASSQAGNCNIVGGTINGNLRVNNNTYTHISGGTINGIVIGVDALAASSSVTIAGNPVIANCSIPAGYKLTLEEMTQGASVTVTASGAFTGTLTDAQSYVGYFHSKDAAGKIEVVDNALHCTKQVQCSHCSQYVTWEPWTDASKSVSGHYYLAEETKTITGQYTIGDDSATYDIVLDLRGNTLQSEVRAFLVQKGSQLTIMDSVGGGKIAAAGLNGNAGAIMVYEGGIFNLLSGTVTRTERKNGTTNGGVIYVSGTGSTMNLLGGVVTGGACSGNGTNVFITTGSVVTVGGNAQVDGGIWAADFESFTVTGSPKIQRTDSAYSLRLPASKMLTVTDPADGMVIGITAEAPFAQNSDADVLNTWRTKGYFTCDVATKEIVIDGDKLTVANKDVRYCAMGHENHDGMECVAPIVTWTAWEETTSLPTATGNYYLTAPVTIGPNNAINADITLDLNGFDVTCVIPAGTTVARRAFIVNEGGKFAITDLSGKETPGTVKVDLDSSFATLADGCVVHVYHGDFTLYNGILDVSKWYTNTRGGTAVVVMNDQIFTMYGGVIKGVQGATNTNGSTVSVYDSASVAIHGGELVGGKGKLGGNIYMSTTGSLTITGGTFKAGKLNSGGHGENIYVTKGIVNISGDAQINGGICCDTATSVTLSGKAVIKAADGSATYDIRFFSNTSVLKGDGTPMMTANGKYTVGYNADGEIETLNLMS